MLLQNHSEVLRLPLSRRNQNGKISNVDTVLLTYLLSLLFYAVISICTKDSRHSHQPILWFLSTHISPTLRHPRDRMDLVSS